MGIKVKRHLLTTAAALTVMTVISKFVGLFREVTLASVFGTTIEMDAYLFALIIPTVVFESIGEGLRLSFIPVIADYANDDHKLWKFFNNIINSIFVITFCVSLISLFVVPYIMPKLPLGFDQDGINLAINLTQIIIFIIIFTSLAPISSGLLNIKNVFIYPELTGVAYSLIIIASALFGARVWGIWSLAVGTIAAEAVKFIFLIPMLYKQGYRYKFYINIKDQSIKKLVKLMMPIIFGSMLFRANIFIERIIGSYLLPGSISALNYAKKLLLLCTGLTESVAVTLVYPLLSKYFATGQMRKFKLLLTKSVNILIILLLPAIGGIAVLGEPIIRILFERGAFDQYAVNMTSIALFFYSFGILGMVLQSIFERSFFAVKDSKTPVISNSIGIAVNIVLNLILIRYFSHGGLALAASISAYVSLIILYLNMHKKIGYLGFKMTVSNFAKTSIAAGLMVIAVLYLCQVLILSELLKISIISIGGALLYFTMFLLLNIKRLKSVKNLFNIG